MAISDIQGVLVSDIPGIVISDIPGLVIHVYCVSYILGVVTVVSDVSVHGTSS